MSTVLSYSFHLSLNPLLPLNRLPNGSRELLVPNRGRVSKVLVHPTKASTFTAHRPYFTPSPSTTSSSNGTARVGVNKEFFRQLKAIAKIIVPRMTSKEVFLIAAHTSFLLLRTYLSLLVAKLDGRLVGDLVSRFRRSSRRSLWLELTDPLINRSRLMARDSSAVSVSGSLWPFPRCIPTRWYALPPSPLACLLADSPGVEQIRYLQQKLSISFRTRLTRYIHDLYLSPKNTFYKVVNLDSRIEGPDQFVTTDVARFCETLSAL